MDVKNAGPDSKCQGLVNLGNAGRSKQIAGYTVFAMGRLYVFKGNFHGSNNQRVGEVTIQTNDAIKSFLTLVMKPEMHQRISVVFCPITF